MSRPVVPVGLIAKRLIEHGRIRFGMRNEKGNPTSIDHFRFTSHDEKVLEVLAEQYGGEVRPWSPASYRSEFELISGASEIGVYLPPDPLGGTPIYELWSGGGWQRRCNGEVCELPSVTPDGGAVQQVPCICDAKGQMVCKPITRLSVILPDVHFGGIWRLETKGWNAAQELPGMVDLVAKLQTKGLTRATLALEMRSSKSGGQTRKFVTPVIRVPASIESIASGQMGIQGMKAPAAQALEDGMNGMPLAPELTVGDEGISDAEVIDVEESFDSTSQHEDLTRLAHQQSLQLELQNPDIAGFCFVVSDGEHEVIKNLTTAQLERLTAVFALLLTGERVYKGLDGKRAVVAKPPEAS